MILLGCLNRQKEAKQEPKQMQTREIKLLIVPIGQIDRKVLNDIGQGVKGELRLDYELAQALPISEEAYNSSRGQYLSTYFLRKLVREYSRPDLAVLGVIDKDLYVPELNFVFGEADLAHRAAVISLIRLREEFYGKKADEALFTRRALTEAIHELGHTFGLSHCNNPHCVMFFSNSLADTDRKGYKFCPRCEQLLNERWYDVLLYICVYKSWFIK